MCGSCFFTDIKTSDCPKTAEATALYDSNFPKPFILLNIKPKYRMMMGSTFMYCAIPINTEINTIGSRTFRKNGPAPSLAIPPNTKFMPSAAYDKR